MDARQKSLIKKLKKDKIPTLVVGLISDKDGKPKFFEVIVERGLRYSWPAILKQVPKKYLGIKVKVV